MAAPADPTTNQAAAAPGSPAEKASRTKRRLLGASIAGLALAAGALTVAAPSPDTAGAQAPAPPAGQIVIFETESTALSTGYDPQACNNAPALAHTITNHTDKPITLYADDRCGVPLVDVAPGFGSHVAPGQSFSESFDETVSDVTEGATDGVVE